MKHSADNSPLGQQTTYVSSYDASQLFPIARAESRKTLGLSQEMLPFHGCDIWTGYELSWLNLKGKPEVAVAEFVIPANSPCIIESKSFKLYLNSLNQTKFTDFEEVKCVLEKDLSAAAGADVLVSLRPLRESNLLIDSTYDASCIDDLDVEIDSYHPSPHYLIADELTKVEEKLCSHLLKSNCPVTGQPDWASVFIEYEGAKIVPENLLRYIISFREHQDFHEHCVERIFMDVLAQCKPASLSVYARYTRRGGLDINPFRSTEKESVTTVGRLLRQ
jgi:7-cyano-7-deazaguanine reductase